MTNLQADPPQGRDESEELRTTGRFSIPNVSPPQGIREILPPIEGDTMVFEDLDIMIYEDGNTMGYEI